MDKTPIFVTGASGQQGGAVARLLLSKGFAVRAFGRVRERLRGLAGMGAEIAVGDLHDLKSLERALTGVKRAFLVTTPWGEGMDAEERQGMHMVDMCRKAGVEHLVFSSVIGADMQTGIPHFETKQVIEKHLEASGVPYTILRPVFFMENFGSEWMLPGIREGKLTLPVHEDVAMPMIPLKAIARFVHTALLKPERFLGQTLPILTDQLSFPEALEKVSKYCGKNIAYAVMSEKESLHAFGEDFTKMFSWFNTKPLQLDLNEAGKWGVPLTTLDEYLQEAQWVRQINTALF